MSDDIDFTNDMPINGAFIDSQLPAPSLNAQKRKDVIFLLLSTELIHKSYGPGQQLNVALTEKGRQLLLKR